MPISVTAAVIRRDGKILIGKRKPGGSCGGLWEFPGGKTEPGETPEECLVRECREELGVHLKVEEFWTEITHAYPDREVCLRFYFASIPEGEPSPLVHEELCWALPGELEKYSFCPAGAPLIRARAEA